MAYNFIMALIDIIYDVVSGIFGTLFGVTVMYIANNKRTKKMNELLLQTRRKVDELARENGELLDKIKAQEEKILGQEQEILARTGRTKRARKSRK